MNVRWMALAAVIGSAIPMEARAQAHDDEAPRSRPGWSLERTMRAFTRDSYDPAGFFPTRGEWEFVLTTRLPSGRDTVTVERYPAERTAWALGPGGPLCSSFRSGDVGRVDGLGMIASSPGAWRRVGAARFVPPGRPDRSAVFVEWRREGGRWVISRFGEQGTYMPRLVGRVAVDWTRDGAGAAMSLPLPDSVRVAGGTEWFERHAPMRLDGIMLMKYGLPRDLNTGDVVRWGTYRGVAVYIEAGAPDDRPVVAFLPIDRAGSFQTYQYMTGDGCG